MIILVAGMCVHFASHAKSAEENYRDKCSVCHDGGAGQAPRIQDKIAWVLRAANGRQALYQTALLGKPNTAMAAKGGYTELSDQEVRDIVDYILQVSGNLASLPLEKSSTPSLPVLTPELKKISPDRTSVRSPLSPLSDLELSKVVAERLRRVLGSAKATLDEYEGIITVRGLGIKVQTQQGVTTLTGTLKEGDHIGKAQTIAESTQGVQKVVNKLIAASVFEWD